MKKEFRLLKSSDFKKVLNEKKRALKNDSVSIYYKKNDLSHIRIGLSVSKKLGNAVVRSTTRRKLRAIISELNVLLYSYDIVIIVREKFLSNTYLENKQILKSCFEYIDRLTKGLINESKH